MRSNRNQLRMLRLTVLAGTLVIVIGTALRSVELISHNYLFGYDQGWASMIVHEMLTERKFRLIGAEASSGSGFPGVFHGPGYYYLLALSYTVFGGNPYGGMLLMWIFGSMAVGGAILLGIRVFGRSGGILFGFLAAVSGPLISQSRFIWPPHPTTVFVIGVIWSLNEFAHRNRYRWYALAAVCAASIYHFHLGVAVPMVIAVGVYGALRSRQRIRLLVLWGISSVIVFLPSIAFEIRHGFLTTRSLIRFLTAGRATTSNPLNPAAHLTTHLMDYWYNLSGTFRFDFVSYPIITFAILPFVVSGIVWSWKSVRRQPITVILTVLMVSYLGLFLLVRNTIWGYYLTPLHLVYIGWFVLSGVSMVRMPASAFRTVWLTVFVGYVFVFCIGTAGEMVRSYTSEIRDTGGVAKISGKTDLLDFVYRDAAGRPFSVHVFTPPVYTYPYDYLFRWYGSIEYGYIPETGSAALTYLIIEKDGSQPWSYAGWLMTLPDVGRTTAQWVLPSGFLVEKRERL